MDQQPCSRKENNLHTKKDLNGPFLYVDYFQKNKKDFEKIFKKLHKENDKKYNKKLDKNIGGGGIITVIIAFIG